jgi:hypothetical protein
MRLRSLSCCLYTCTCDHATQILASCWASRPGISRYFLQDIIGKSCVNMVKDEPQETAVGFGQRAKAVEVRPIVGQKLAHSIAVTLCYGTVVTLRELLIGTIARSQSVRESTPFSACIASVSVHGFFDVPLANALVPSDKTATTIKRNMALPSVQILSPVARVVIYVD